MAELEILSKQVTYSSPPFMIIDYRYNGNVAAGTDMTSSEDLIMLAPSMDHINANLRMPNNVVNGQAYVIMVNSFSIACLSDKYDVRIFNKSGSPSSLLNTTNEVLIYDDVELSMLDTTLGEFVIVNKDAPMSNKLYLYVSNQGTIDTGPITISMNYNVLQNRPF